jgi:hypothetical protein
LTTAIGIGLLMNVSMRRFQLEWNPRDLDNHSIKFHHQPWQSNPNWAITLRTASSVARYYLKWA